MKFLEKIAKGDSSFVKNSLSKVLWRKGCFGNQSDNGSRFTERILTTVATLKQQDRNIVEYGVAAIQAHRIGQLAPSLLPVDLLLVEAA